QSEQREIPLLSPLPPVQHWPGPLHWPGDYRLCAGEARGGGRFLCSSTAGFHHAEKAWLRKQLGIGRFKASGASCPQMNDRFNEQAIKSKEKIMSTNITKKLAGKVALVTGGSRSIGAAIAKRLATDGAAVALTYSASPGKANEVVRSIEAAGGKALAIKADAADTEAVRLAVAK